MDLEKVTPAPWQVECFPVQGYTITAGPPDNAAERFSVDDPMSPEDCEFCALARNAFDVMLRRGWWPVPMCVGGRWVVRTDEDGDPPGDWPDPFTALVEADLWYREHVEGKGGRA